MKRLLLIALLLLLPLVLAPLALALAILDEQPLVIDVPHIDGSGATGAKRLIRDTLDRLIQADGGARLVFRKAELNALAGLASRAIDGLRGRVNLSPLGLEAAVTLELPTNPLGRFANARLGIAPSTGGLELTHLTLGGWQIPGSIAQPALLLLAGLVGGDEPAVFITAIERVSMSREQIEVALRPVPDAARRLGRIRARLASYRDRLSPIDRDRVAGYLGHLVALLERSRGEQRQSLDRYVAPLFAEAGRRASDSDPAVENGAALIALAVLFGSDRFEQLIGPVRPPGLPAAIPRPRHLTLAGRDDLRLHFVISAGLRILSSQGISVAIGEFKELLDSDRGSGFSFVDLAADRAGIRLAERATDPARAAVLQQRLALTLGEAAFFPAIDGLPEGLQETEFEHRFGGLEGARYRALVAEIDRRIERLAALAD